MPRHGIAQSAVTERYAYLTSDWLKESVACIAESIVYDILTMHRDLKIETLGEAQGGRTEEDNAIVHAVDSGANSHTPTVVGRPSNSRPRTKEMVPSADSSHLETVPMRWCTFIDILGFSKLWESRQCKALKALRELMGAIHRVGTWVYPGERERLFVHQMGDGFAIVSDFGERSFERPLGIASALMRHLASTGTFAAAAVAEGEFSDITGCYPEEVMKACEDGHVVPLSAGLMTLSPVMGTAFIRAHSLHAHAPSGPFEACPRPTRIVFPAGSSSDRFKARGTTN